MAQFVADASPARRSFFRRGATRPRHRARRRWSLRRLPALVARTLLRLAGELVLTLTCLLGVAILGLTAIAHFTDAKPFIAKSGSMEPSIGVGALVIAMPVAPDDVELGDVIVARGGGGVRIVHRVVGITRTSQGQLQFQTKGDANEDVDELPVLDPHPYRSVFVAPNIGRVPRFLATPGGGFSLGCVVSGALFAILHAQRMKRQRACAD